MAALQWHWQCLWYLVSLLSFTSSQNYTCSLEGEVRLTGGGVSHEGRVEICIGGLWGTVCDDHWDSDEASVVCRQLGFQDTDAVGRRHSVYGQGAGPIHQVRYSCMGDEAMLNLCESHREVCHHDDEAGVSCRQVSCTNGDIRLVDGTFEHSGRVEVCLNQQWTSVCDNNWSYQDAAVACKQLGYNSSGALPTLSANSVVRPRGLQFLNCSGWENKLIDCPVIPQLHCNTTHTVGVLCSPPTTREGPTTTTTTTTTLTNDMLLSDSIFPWIIAGVIVGVLVGVVLLLVVCLLVFYCARLRALNSQQHQCSQHPHCHCTCTSSEEGQNIKLSSNESYATPPLSTEDLLEESDNPCYEHRSSVCLAEANPCYGYRNPDHSSDIPYYETLLDHSTKNDFVPSHT